MPLTPFLSRVSSEVDKAVRAAIVGAALTAAEMALPRFGGLGAGTEAWERAKWRWE